MASPLAKDQPFTPHPSCADIAPAFAPNSCFSVPSSLLRWCSPPKRAIPKMAPSSFLSAGLVAWLQLRWANEKLPSQKAQIRLSLTQNLDRIQLFSGTNYFTLFKKVAAPLKMVQAPKRVLVFFFSPGVAEPLSTSAVQAMGRLWFGLIFLGLGPSFVELTQQLLHFAKDRQAQWGKRGGWEGGEEVAGRRLGQFKEETGCSVSFSDI